MTPENLTEIEETEDLDTCEECGCHCESTEAGMCEACCEVYNARQEEIDATQSEADEAESDLSGLMDEMEDLKERIREAKTRLREANRKLAKLS